MKDSKPNFTHFAAHRASGDVEDIKELIDDDSLPQLAPSRDNEAQFGSVSSAIHVEIASDSEVITATDLGKIEFDMYP